MANAAWLALAVMAHNLGRAVGQLAGPDLETGDRRDAAPQGLHHARPARAQRPTTAPTTARPLALGRRDHHRTRPHPRHPAALLNNHPRHDDQDLGEAGRPAAPACPTTAPSASTTGSPLQPRPTRSTVDPGLESATVAICAVRHGDGKHVAYACLVPPGYLRGDRDGRGHSELADVFARLSGCRARSAGSSA